MTTNKKVEVLAPVGSYEMYEAAKAAKANAIYMAGSQFGARAYADNFELEQLNKLVIDAHKHKIRVYITVNTLVKDSEFKHLYAYLQDLSLAGVDALIVQDLGVVSMIREHFPHFELHASTQMTVNNLQGAKVLEALGFDRVVVGREVSLQEIALIKKETSLEIEAFVHGSLCVSVSGQCLISSFVGGRSGNRGRCAQPCRKGYDIYNKQGKKINQAMDTFLSARDLMTIDQIQMMIDSGVDSLKIEGRMKKPEYVYTAVSAYQAAMAGLDYSKDDLALVSNRQFTKGLFQGDFGKAYYNSDQDTAGVYLGKIQSQGRHKSLILDQPVYVGDSLVLVTDKGKRLNLTMTNDYQKAERITFTDYPDLKENSPVYKLFSQKIVDKLDEALEETKERKLAINIKLVAKLGQVLSAIASLGDKQVAYQSDFIVEKATKNPTSVDQIKKQMDRLGQTDYRLASIDIDMDRDIFLPKSRLNELRRALTDALDASFVDRLDYKEAYQESNQAHIQEDQSYKLTYESYGAVNEELDLSIFDRIYLHRLDQLAAIRQSYDGLIYFVLPRMKDERDYDKLKELVEDKQDLLDGLAYTELGDIEAFKDVDLAIHLESYFNIFNQKAVSFLNENGFYDLSLSQELNLDQLKNLRAGTSRFEMIGYGRLSQMLLKHCPASIIKGCLDDSNCLECPFSQGLELRNKQDILPMTRAFGYSDIVTSKPVNILGLKKEFDQTKIRQIRLVDRGEKEIIELAKHFQEVYLEAKEKKFDPAYTGHYQMGVI